MDYKSLVINNRQYAQIVSDFASGKANHAYMLTSADTNFTFNMAYMLCAVIAGTTIDKVTKNIHPDIFVFGKDGKIDVNQVNEIIETISVAPYSADKKVYCLLNIEAANETSQNKLLKSLEEPPKNVVFILTCKNTKNILSTVLSRVKIVNIDPLSSNDILNLLTSSGTSVAEAQIAVNCCNGNSTLAQKLTNANFVKMYNNILDMLANLNSSRDCLKYATIFENKNVDKNEFLDTTVLLVRDIALILCGNTNLVVNKQQIDLLTKISNSYTLNATSNIISECLLLKEDLYYNTNSTAVLDKFLFTLAQEKVKCKK